MTILFIDHNDSFVHNLINWFKAYYKPGVKVIHYQELKDTPDKELLQDIKAVVFSPGPGHPRDYPHSIAFYRSLPAHMWVLGVCLGHQIMLHAYGAQLTQIAARPAHGQQVKLSQKMVSHFLPDKVLQGFFVLYNSWGVPAADEVFQTHFKILASIHGVSLAAEHTCFSHVSVQFHPESFASTGGARFLHSFLRSFYTC